MGADLRPTESCRRSCGILSEAQVRPNFLVIGAVKCGTSSLCKLLGGHPAAFMCDPREPFFFSHDRNYLGKGWDWYESLFVGAAGKAAIGEGSTTYTQQALFPDAAPRIAKHLPDARLIYITRQPLEQIESLWIWLRSFWDTVAKDGIRADADFNLSVKERTPILIETARYWKQISRYRDSFPDDRILVLFLEDFKRDPDAVLARCFEFLGIDPEVRIPESDTPINVSKQLRFDRWFLKPLRMLPGAGVARRGLPRGLHAALRPLVRKPVGGRPQWDADTRGWALDQLAEDSRRFLQHFGKPADFWDLDDR
jgi:hypothetical protein